MNKKETDDFLLFTRTYHLTDKLVTEVIRIYNNHVAAQMAAHITGYSYV